MFNISDINFISKIKTLKLKSVYQLQIGNDNLDQVAFEVYNSTLYWYYIAYYNDVINPFELINQGFTTLRLFNKSDLEELLG